MSNQLSAVVELQDLCPWQLVAGKPEKCVSPAFYSKDVLWRRRWWWTHSSVWWSRWHGCSCMGHWIHRITGQHQIIKVHVRMKVSLVIGLFQRPQGSGTVTENRYGFFVNCFHRCIHINWINNLTLSASQTNWKDKSDESFTLIENSDRACTRKSKFVIHSCKTVNVFVRFKFWKATNILSKYVCIQAG